MIKVNLLGDDAIQDPTGILWVGGFVASLVLFVIVSFFMYQDLSSSVEAAKTEVADLETELAQIQKTTKEVRDLEKKRKELNEKLAVIARLKKSKLGPVRVMDDLNIGVPERAWITEMKEKDGLMRIAGNALDNQTIAIFMKSLLQSDYFTTVDLVETKKVSKQGVKIKAFVLQAKVSYSGKIKLDDTKDGKGKKKA